MRFLKGEKCSLRALEPTDIDFLYQLENDESLWEVSETQTPFSRFILQEYLQNAHQSIYQIKQLRMVVVREETPIGFIDLYEYDAKNHRAGVGIVIQDKYREQGIGTEALRIFVDYAFTYLDLHQLYAEIIQDNQQSIRIFEKTGFTLSAIKQDWIYTKGRFKNVLFYQKIIDFH